MTAGNAIPIVYLITAGKLNDGNYREGRFGLLELFHTAAAAGVTHIQIREKQLSADLLCELAAEASEIFSGTTTKLLINDRADIAAAVGADGVHLTSTSIDASIIRKSFPGLFIGLSVHSERDIQHARNYVDLVMYGPVFETPGKGSAIGVERLAKAVQMFPDVPIVAVGGIDESNWASVVDAGAAGFAAIRWLGDREKLPDIMREVRNAS